MPAVLVGLSLFVFPKQSPSLLCCRKDGDPATCKSSVQLPVLCCLVALQVCMVCAQLDALVVVVVVVAAAVVLMMIMMLMTMLMTMTMTTMMMMMMMMMVMIMIMMMMMVMIII